MAEIFAFVREGRQTLRPETGAVTSPEVIVFPRTNIRVLRKMWGLPEEGLVAAGSRIGALQPDVTTG